MRATIRSLEKDLGTPLFHRTGRRVVLTEAGRALIAPARQAGCAAWRWRGRASPRLRA
ncbi:LysR family transcriptional regulator [Actinomadura sp. 3N407]|uniref:LysR family transcriptional regulator n=1 Tax=Actinomadura sp. 3N407 TaxID=3457423 RepID=UPI003FCCAF28